MKKKIIILMIILIFIIYIVFWLRNLKKNKGLTLEELLIFNMWKNTDTYVLDVEKSKQLEINLYKTINGGGNLYKKIAPGTKGEFVIIIKKNEDLKCKIIFFNITKKPKNLKFYLNEKVYNSLEEMQSEINEILKKEDKITINWEWRYSVDEQGDIEDTKDGELLKEYVFKMDTIVEN